MKSARQAITRLCEIRNRYGDQYAGEKLGLLGQIPDLAVRAATDVRKLHQSLCFLRAFPDSAEIHDRVVDFMGDFGALIDGLSESQRLALNDTGIAGTDVHYHFSYEVASWMARHAPAITAIDWPELPDTSRLDELLEHVLHHSETDYFDSGYVSTEEWLGLAAANQPGTDFDWLMSQLGDRRHHGRFWTSLYNAAEVPLRCRLGNSGMSKTTNVFAAETIYHRAEGMRGRVPNAKREIARPVRSVTRLSKTDGSRLLDVAMSSLAVRHRETIHFNYANHDEVYLADVGNGINIAVTGLQPEHRYPLECTMGFLILSNGVPIGYGGSSMLFRQTNTGVNIFDEYRGSEAAWLWVQVMRVFHALTGCTRFVANPYQFGSENTEALQSGAFWFYYRLGYRPVEKTVADLARKEFVRVRGKKGYRSPLGTLRKLATCDMHLTLLGAKQSEFFDENWIEFGSLLATQQLANVGKLSRRKAHDELARKLVEELGIRSMREWSPEERRWFVRFSPIVAAVSPSGWTKSEKDRLVSLMRAKGSRAELDYSIQFRQHTRFFQALKKACRQIA